MGKKKAGWKWEPPNFWTCVGAGLFGSAVGCVAGDRLWVALLVALPLSFVAGVRRETEEQ